MYSHKILTHTTSHLGFSDENMKIFFYFTNNSIQAQEDKDAVFFRKWL